MQVDEKTLHAIVTTRIKFSAEKAFVFGSRARGQADFDSDTDICFIFAAFPEDPMELMFHLRRSIHSITDEPIDILVFESEVFERKALEGSSLEYTILVEGVAV